MINITVHLMNHKFSQNIPWFSMIDTTLNEEEWHHGTLINDDLIIEIMF